MDQKYLRPKLPPQFIQSSQELFPISPPTKKSREKSVIICCSSLPSLGKSLEQLTHLRLFDYSCKIFANGELLPTVENSVRGKHVYLIQSICPPKVNDYLVELLLVIDLLKKASSKTITVIIPHYGYARQDRKLLGRVPISASLVARLYESAGADRVVSFDLHCGQIQGFFKIPCDNIPAGLLAVDYFSKLIKNKKFNNIDITVISPDAGGATRAKDFMVKLGKNLDKLVNFAMISKERKKSNVVSGMTLVGEVKGNLCIIIDDMVDTAGTLVKAANLLKEEGAKIVYAFATHGIFSDPAVNRIENSVLEEVVVCNTIQPTGNILDSKKIKYLEIDFLLASVISQISSCGSVSNILEI